MHRLMGIGAIALGLCAPTYGFNNCTGVERLAFKYRNAHERTKRVPGHVVYSPKILDENGVEVREYSHVVDSPEGPIKLSHVRFRDHGDYFYISDTWTHEEFRGQGIHSKLIKRLVDDHPQTKRYLSILGLVNYSRVKAEYEKGVELEDALFTCAFCRSMASAGFSKVEEGSVEWDNERRAVRLILVRP